MIINGKRVITNGKFAFDGCHKIYVIADYGQEEDMRSIPYIILPIDKLEETYRNSCPLRFIDSADLSVKYVDQGEDAEFTYEPGDLPGSSPNVSDMVETLRSMNTSGPLVSDDYIGRIAEAIAKDVVEDVIETADPDSWNLDDVRLAVGRVLCDRLGV